MSLKSIQKRENGILDKNYYDGRFVKLSFRNNVTKTLNYGIGFSQKLKTHPNFEINNRANISLDFTRDNLKFSETISTSNDINLNVEYDLHNVLKKTICYATLRSNWALKTKEATITVKNKGDNHSFNTKLTAGDEKLLVSRLELFQKRKENHYGISVKCGYQLSNAKFSLSNALFYFRNREFAFYLMHQDRSKVGFTLDKLTAFLSHRVSDDSEVGLRLKHSFRNNTDELEFGGRFKINDNLNVQAKIDDKFNISTVFALKVNKWMKVVLSSKHEVTPTKEHSNLFPIGFKVKIDNPR
eukprot:TRINITY_DN1549_c0_g3_i1.p1 TRINITY_DN1549_c0_g3~~TRINITY_DN1549_c0_g3_i1.p1  ORF type:complete len:299 (-),score=86.24 TRINITY_DN1549_c0_g3_i1:119-1015(-)